MVVKCGVKKSRVETCGWKVRGWDVLQSFVNFLCKLLTLSTYFCVACTNITREHLLFSPSSRTKTARSHYKRNCHTWVECQFSHFDILHRQSGVLSLSRDSSSPLLVPSFAMIGSVTMYVQCGSIFFQSWKVKKKAWVCWLRVKSALGKQDKARRQESDRLIRLPACSLKTMKD